MAPLLSAILLLGLLPSTLAGPACAQKFKSTSDCILKCSTRWGYPGMMMGTDAWGSVMQTTGKTIDDWNLYVAQACGDDSSSNSTGTEAVGSDPSSNSTESDNEPTTPIIAHGLATQAEPSPASSSTLTSSRFVTSSRSTTSTTTTHSTTATQAEPTTTSTTPKPIPQTTKAPAASPTPAKPASTPSSNSNTGNTGNTGSTSNSGNSGNSGSTSNGGTTSSSSSSGGGDNGSRASDADVQAYLQAHNTIRAQHGAVPIVWSNAAAVKAQQWADECKNQHSGGTLGPLGENLAAGTGDYSIATAVKQWTDEVSKYNPNAPVASHFTQVVWKASTQLGCAVQTCPNIFPGFGPAQYYVCEYSVQGNVEGEFGQNVQV